MNPDARAREHPGLTPEQRAEAERLQADLDRRREQFGVEDTRPKSAAAVALRAVQSNPEPGNPVEE